MTREEFAEIIFIVIEETLGEYNLQYTEGDDGDSIRLVDILTPSWSDTIEPGTRELGLLVESIGCNLRDALLPNYDALAIRVVELEAEVVKWRKKAEW